MNCITSSVRNFSAQLDPDRFRFDVAAAKSRKRWIREEYVYIVLWTSPCNLNPKVVSLNAEEWYNFNPGVGLLPRVFKLRNFSNQFSFPLEVPNIRILLYKKTMQWLCAYVTNHVHFLPFSVQYFEDFRSRQLQIRG